MDTLSQQIIERYISGEATVEEIALVNSAFADNKEMLKKIDALRKGFEDEDFSEGFLMESPAGYSEDNLCDVLCEQYILRDYGIDIDIDNIRKEAEDNFWIKDSGTPMHNIGRLLEKHGMTVQRNVGCNLDDLQRLISVRYRIIAVVDYGELCFGEADDSFHAVVCTEINEDEMLLFDPFFGEIKHYPTDDFIRAWEKSGNYLVWASTTVMEYIPHPMNVDDVQLDADLLDLSEIIAENAHEEWALKRKNEGVKWGPKRDDEKKENPCMVPYCELPEEEKETDRITSLNTIKLVKKLGFTIHRRYTKYCRECGEYVGNEMKFCPNCGKQLPEL